MKRIIATLVLSFGMVLSQVASAQALARYWTVEMFDPAASTSNRSLNVAYNVFSNLDSDNSFTVKLLQNGSEVGTQNVVHANGDSGAFNVTLPANGSYTFKVVATNNVAGETKESDNKTVQVVDGPAPNVVTVANTSTTAGGRGGGAVAGDTNGDGIVDDANGDGVVDAQAAQTNDDADDKDVLGSETRDEAGNGSNTGWYLGAAALLAGLGAYYFYFLRSRIDR